MQTMLLSGIAVAAKTKKYDKRYYCLYCGTPQSKLPRHLKSKHGGEQKVIEMVASTVAGERLKLLTWIRHKGNHEHNLKVYKEGHGEIQVVYRDTGSQSKSEADYIPCTSCLGWFGVSEMARHKDRCAFNTTKHVKGQQHVRAGRNLKPAPSEASAQFHVVLSNMQADDVALVVKSEGLLHRYGERLSIKHGHDINRHVYIRSKLREMGRMLIELRQLDNSILSLKDAIHPSKFSVILQAARNLAQYDKTKNLFEKPSLALKIGTTFVSVVDVLYSEAIENSDETLQKRCQSLKELFQIRWATEYTVNAHRTNIERKKNTINVVPLTEDVAKLTRYLKEEIATQVAAEKALPSKNSYVKLQKALLALVILFNRRRSGEVSRMKLQEYCKNSTGTQTLSENDLNLSDLEKELAHSFSRVEITGKKGRTVPVLLTSRMKTAMDLIVSNRQHFIGSDSTNEYVFAIIADGSSGFLRGWDVLRSFSVVCGALRPDALRSTKLRKHIATMTQIMNLKDNELDILANFMGHDVRVHRQFYRMPDEAIQVAKVSRFLLTVERGELTNYSGQSLDDLPVPDDELEGAVYYIVMVKY